MDSTTTDASENFLKLLKLIENISSNIPDELPSTENAINIYWYDINQKTWDLQDFLNNFNDEIEKLQLADISCTTICLFRDHIENFVYFKRRCITNVPDYLQGAKYGEAKERAGNVVALFKATSDALKARFYYLIAKREIAKNRNREEGTDFY